MRHLPLQAPLLWQTYLAFWIAGILAAPWPFPATICALLLLWADDRLWRCSRLVLAVLCLLGGLMTAQWQLYGAPLRTTPAPIDEQEWIGIRRYCGIVRNTRGLPGNRLRILLENMHQATRQDDTSTSDNPPLSGLVQWTWESPAYESPLPGQTVCLSRRIIPAQGFANQKLPDWGISQAAQGVRWRVWSKGDSGQPRVHGEGTHLARWREALRQGLLRTLLPTKAQNKNIPADSMPIMTSATDLPQGKAILLALLFGDRRYVEQKTLDNFAAATLAHSLALSGQHLAVAGLAGLLCILTIARLSPQFYLQRPRLIWTLLASLPLAFLYLWLGNAPASLLRATGMLAVLTLFALWGRPHTTLDVLCIALLGISIVAPLAVLDTGLQLSALCVTAIGLALPWLRCHDPFAQATEISSPQVYSFPRRVWRALWHILLISLILQTALLPLNLLLFGNMGHWFAFNLLWLPIADGLVLPTAALGLLCSTLGLEAPAWLALEVAALPCQLLVDGLDRMASLGWLQSPALLRPHWTALPAFAALLTALAAQVGRSNPPAAMRRLLLAGIILLCIGPLQRTADRVCNEIRLSILDVGQSQALILHLPGHTRLLMDGGGSASPRFEPGHMLTGPALTRNDAPRLAGVLNTHPDLDHMGGLLYVLKHFDVPLLLDNGRSSKGEKGKQWEEVRRLNHALPLRYGDVLLTDTPGLRLEILHPPVDEVLQWQGNNASVVARLVWHNRGLALFMGDAERPVLRRLLANGDNLQAEVLVAPHHGSGSSFMQTFYEAVQPKLVIASCGLANRYGYPAKRLRDWLAAAGIPLLYTGRDGEVSVTWKDATPCSVHTARYGSVSLPQHTDMP